MHLYCEGKSKEVLILVPTYPARYRLLQKFINSYNANKLYNQSDLCFIITSEKEEKLFHTKVGIYDTVVLPDDMIPPSGEGIINIKKFYGIRIKAKEYKYIIVMDDDALFCKSVDLQRICDTYFEKKILISSISSGKGSGVLGAAHACKRFFRDSPYKEKIGNIDLLWFNQPCIYKSDTIHDFFDRTGIGEWLRQLTSYDFDYLIYMYYLILYCDFKIISCGIKSDLPAAEITSDYSFEIISNEYKTLPFLCATEYMQTILPSENIFITWHTDREINMKTGGKRFIKKCFLKSSAILKNIGSRL